MDNSETIIIERAMTPEEIAESIEREKEAIALEKTMAEDARRQGYVRISDPVYMQYARGDKTKEEWLAAVAEVELLYPIPTQDIPQETDNSEASK